MLTRLRGTRPFYGWAIVAVGGLVAFSSGPGQTFTFSVFIDPIIEDTGIERTLISTIYAVGTGVSAAMVFFVSRLADRVGARITCAAAGVALGLACFAIGFSQGLIAFFLSFAALRALGQGSLTINATLMVAQWFSRKRGRAVAVMGLGFPLSLALLPALSRVLIDNIGWREAYMVLGVMVWILVVPGALLIARNRPEDMGLFPDGASEALPGEAIQPGRAVEDRRPILTSAAFWMLAVPLATSSLVSTGLMFHQTAIFVERGLTPAAAAFVFVPIAVFSAASSIVAGFVVDRIGPKYTFYGNMCLLLGSMVVIRFLDAPGGVFFYGIVLGASNGVTRVIAGVTWAHYYGRIGLGRVQGSAMMINITASALGPMPLAWLQAWFGNFGPGIAIMAVLPVAAMLMMSLARPQRTTLGSTAGSTAG
jgi:MFS family permease